MQPLRGYRDGKPDYVGMKALVDQAVALAPDRPDLVWLQIEACDRVNGCDPAPLEARLRALDPSNGVVEFGALRRAVNVHDDEALDAALTGIGRSERVDIYWTTLFGRLGAALASTHQLSESEALTAIAGSLAALPLVSYPQASHACKGDGLQRPGRLDACRRLAASFERGDGMLTEGVGAAIAMRVWPSGSPEWAEAAQLRRVEHYRMQVVSQHPDPLTRPRATHRFMELLAQHRREQDVFAAELLAEGVPPDPPANWVDPTPN